MPNDPPGYLATEKLSVVIARAFSGIAGESADNAATQAQVDSVAAAFASHILAAATDAELVSGLALKQDASTAATDDELASLNASITSLLSAKQGADTAATDAELADAVSFLTSAIASKLNIGTGPQDETTFRRGDGVWAVPPAGSGGGGGTVAGFTVTNYEPDKTLDADAASLREVNNYIGTITAAMQAGTPISGFVVINAEPDTTLDADASSLRETCNFLKAFTDAAQAT